MSTTRDMEVARPVGPVGALLALPLHALTATWLWATHMTHIAENIAISVTAPFVSVSQGAIHVLNTILLTLHGSPAPKQGNVGMVAGPEGVGAGYIVNLGEAGAPRQAPEPATPEPYEPTGKLFGQEYHGIIEEQRGTEAIYPDELAEYGNPTKIFSEWETMQLPPHIREKYSPYVARGRETQRKSQELLAKGRHPRPGEDSAHETPTHGMIRETKETPASPDVLQPSTPAAPAMRRPRVVATRLEEAGALGVESPTMAEPAKHEQAAIAPSTMVMSEDQVPTSAMASTGGDVERREQAAAPVHEEAYTGTEKMAAPKQAKAKPLEQAPVHEETSPLYRGLATPGGTGGGEIEAESPVTPVSPTSPSGKKKSRGPIRGPLHKAAKEIRKALFYEG